MDKILQRMYQSGKVGVKHVQKCLCCYFSIYLFSERNVALKKMFPFYINTFLGPFFVRNIKAHILEQKLNNINRVGKQKEKKPFHISEHWKPLFLFTGYRGQEKISHTFDSNYKSMILKYFHSILSINCNGTDE